MKQLNLPIGGFFPEERINNAINCSFYHDTDLALKNGRACLNFILKHSPYIKQLYMPFYQCEDVHPSLIENDVEVIYYHIDAQFELISAPVLEEHQALLYVNYFGLKGEYTMELYQKYKGKLILDNTQAFFDQSEVDFRFNTARKFFGVSDGGFLFAPSIDLAMDIPRFESPQHAHLKLLKKGDREKAFIAYRAAEKTMNHEIERISQYSCNVLSAIDYEKVKKKRIRNFNLLANGLNQFNQLKFEKIHDNSMVPFCYPFLPNKKLNREELIEKQIFFPKLWPCVYTHNLATNSIEVELTDRMFPLPIDHRFGENEMMYIIQTIENLWSV